MMGDALDSNSATNIVMFVGPSLIEQCCDIVTLCWNGANVLILGVDNGHEKSRIQWEEVLCAHLDYMCDKYKNSIIHLCIESNDLAQLRTSQFALCKSKSLYNKGLEKKPWSGVGPTNNIMSRHGHSITEILLHFNMIRTIKDTYSSTIEKSEIACTCIRKLVQSECEAGMCIESCMQKWQVNVRSSVDISCLYLHKFSEQFRDCYLSKTEQKNNNNNNVQVSFVPTM